jgi:hypothetical protein
MSPNQLRNTDGVADIPCIADNRLNAEEGDV